MRLRFCLHLSFLLCISPLAAGQTAGPGRVAVAPSREQVAGIAGRYVGVTEATGRNDGPEVEAFLASVGLPRGHAYCAAFVHYCFAKAGLKTPINAWAPTAVASNRIYAKGQLLGPLPRAGDVFGIYFPKLKRVGHVGFVERWPATGVYATTVEANTSPTAAFGSAQDRNGDGVYRKYRAKSMIFAVSNWIGN